MLLLSGNYFAIFENNNQFIYGFVPSRSNFQNNINNFSFRTSSGLKGVVTLGAESGESLRTFSHHCGPTLLPPVNLVQNQDFDQL